MCRITLKTIEHLQTGLWHYKQFTTDNTINPDVAQLGTLFL